MLSVEPVFDGFAAAREMMGGPSAGPQSQSRLVVVAFVDRWSTPAMRMAMEVEAVRNGGDLRFAHLFILDT